MLDTQQNPLVRRLAAIMFTDIVGYTAMMQENEQATAAIRRRHRAVFENEHQHHHGEIIQYYGDGTLSIFQSAVEAVECAIAMQKNFQTGEIVPLRIGIHLGDIVFNNNDIYGDGVNVASRIETLGIPGCILISDKLNFAVKNQSSISSQSLGYFEFKNIKEPIEVFAITNTGIRIPNRTELKGKLKENKKSIAVLPFVNMSSDPENEYFSDGVAEEILNALVKVEGFQVTARTSSFSFKGKSLDVREIGRQLGAAHILEGSVRRAGNQVRITAQLVSSIDGYHFFSETYDRTLEDIFAVQDEIAQKIANKLREQLGEKERQQSLVVAPTDNLEAYEQYLRGLFYINQLDAQAAMKAIPFFEKAISLQSDFALPYAYLARCHLFLSLGGRQSWAETHRKGMPYIKRALELDPDLGITYSILGSFQAYCEWDWLALKKTCEKLLEIGRGEALTYHRIAQYHVIQGDLDAALAAELAGLQLNPMSIQINLVLGMGYTMKGQYQIANDYLDKVLELVPNQRTALEFKGWNCVYQKQYVKSIAYFNQMTEMGWQLHRSTCLGWAYAQIGESEKAAYHLSKLESLLQDNQHYLPYLDLAIIHTGMGNKDQAFSYLERAIETKIGGAMMALNDINQVFLSLKSDSRYEALKKKAGLTNLPPLKKA